jgi:hypothetical protein
LAFSLSLTCLASAAAFFSRLASHPGIFISSASSLMETRLLELFFCVVTKHTSTTTRVNADRSVTSLRRLRGATGAFASGKTNEECIALRQPYTRCTPLLKPHVGFATAPAAPPPPPPPPRWRRQGEKARLFVDDFTPKSLLKKALDSESRQRDCSPTRTAPNRRFHWDCGSRTRRCLVRGV